VLENKIKKGTRGENDLKNKEAFHRNPEICIGTSLKSNKGSGKSSKAT
jgi:hypothetical protein